MALPICLDIPALDDPFALDLPGGIEHVNLMEVIQPALTPLVPLFDVVDTIVAVYNCMKAIPDSLGPPPDPTAIAICTPELGEKVAKLLRLIPQLPLHIFRMELIEAVVGGLACADTYFPFPGVLTGPGYCLWAPSCDEDAGASWADLIAVDVLEKLTEPITLTFAEVITLTQGPSRRLSGTLEQRTI